MKKDFFLVFLSFAVSWFIFIGINFLVEESARNKCLEEKINADIGREPIVYSLDTGIVTGSRNLTISAKDFQK